MYVLHFFFAYKVTRALGKLLVPKIGGVPSLMLLLVVAMLGSYLVAAIAHWLMEVRCIGLGRQLILRLRQRGQLFLPPQVG